MRKLVNKDGTPRKRRADCKFFRLPDTGRDEFMVLVNANRANPNVEQLQAVAARHGVDWSAQNIYEFLKSPRCEEQLIAAQIRFQRGLGEALADTGADKLHADSRRLAIGHWMTILRCAQVIYSDPNSEATAQTAAYANASDATDKLVALGALKSGEDKGALALAKLKLDQQKYALDREKFETEIAEKLLDESLRARAAQIADSTAPRAEKIAQLRQAYFADIDAEKVVLPK